MGMIIVKKNRGGKSHETVCLTINWPMAVGYKSSDSCMYIYVLYKLPTLVVPADPETRHFHVCPVLVFLDTAYP